MDRDEGKRRLKGPLEILSRYKYVLLVAAVGAVLLLWPSGEGTRRQAEEPQAAPQTPELRAT